MHWNTPANPVNFEQREGRIDRYAGHAIRRNIVAKHREAILRSDDYDPWKAAFRLGLDEQERFGEFAPWWVYPGAAKIERIVMRIPIKPATDPTLKPATCNAPKPATRNALNRPARALSKPAPRAHESHPPSTPSDRWASGPKPTQRDGQTSANSGPSQSQTRSHEAALARHKPVTQWTGRVPSGEACEKQRSRPARSAGRSGTHTGMSRRLSCFRSFHGIRRW